MFSDQRDTNMAENMSVDIEESMVCGYLFCLVVWDSWCLRWVLCSVAGGKRDGVRVCSVSP